MKLSLYLFIEGHELDTPSLSDSTSLPLEQLSASSDLPFPHLAYVVRNNPRPVPWADYVRPYFDLGEVENVTNSFVLLFEAAERVWAVTYGQGFHALDAAKIEPGFGMRVVANCIDPEAVKSADVRTSDVLSRLTRAQVSAGAGIRELGVAVDNEMVRHLAGRLLPGDPDGNWAGAMSGADSLQLDIRWSLDNLPEQCQRILDRYKSDRYKQAFSFIDNFQPVKADDPRIDMLDAGVFELIDGRSSTKLSVAAPEMIEFDDLDHYEIWRRRERAAIELSIGSIFEFLDSLSPSIDAKQAVNSVHLLGIDESGGPVGRERTLYRYIAAEVELSGRTYALVSGQWYEIDAGYIASINSIIGHLPDLTEDLGLPPLERRYKDGKPFLESERAYNERVASGSAWTLLDRRNISYGGPHQRIEAADLANAMPARLVHVKKMTDSATLSHLWGQGSVSAELYKLDGEYRAKVLEKCPGLPDDMSNIDVIYAVVTDRPGSIADELFFFSKVNLAQYLRSLELIGSRVALVKIDIIDAG